MSTQVSLSEQNDKIWIAECAPNGGGQNVNWTIAVDRSRHSAGKYSSANDESCIEEMGMNQSNKEARSYEDELLQNICIIMTFESWK